MQQRQAGSGRTKQREWGRYYTPAEFAREMLQGLLLSWGKEENETEFPTILDPACGEGVFLLTAYDELRRRHLVSFTQAAENRLELFRRYLFGVDVDENAVERLRESFLERLKPSKRLKDKAIRVIAANLRVGDAITGADFSSENHENSNQMTRRNVAEPSPLNWPVAFPDVAKTGGFDTVIANPPYLREKNAKPMFDRIAESPLGKKYRDARMDLWFYFLHRSLDVLKPNGVLSFIVNAYWTASTGAKKMIERLQQETAFEEVVLLGDRPVFPGVTGRHLIFRLRRGRQQNSCRVVDRSQKTFDDHKTEGSTHHLTHDEIFTGGNVRFERPDGVLAILKSHGILGDCYEVRQGIAENPPVVTRRHLELLDESAKLGEGVFVLSRAEITALKLSPDESELLRPYYRPTAFDRFQTPGEPTHFVLYLTKETAPTLDEFPKIEQHLKRFRPVLEQRRETQLGKTAWWQLHWPREDRLFTEPRILSIQMGKRPQFAWAERPTFVGFSVNVVLENEQSTFQISSLTGILNSEIAARWFTQNAKRRGTQFEINGGTLRRFPLPDYELNADQKLAMLVARRQSRDGDAVELEREIEQNVFTLYGLS